ncbi:MAG TPA: amidohydrolase family protein [Alphaproteobacteria bacterium]|jgi:N-acyl-D-aspartate/D-glutamate deacylase|nr:amidohydrolase family protein [Alphaproteobacteria bacterium]
MANQYDLIIRGGLIADGSGGALFTADVAVKDGRVAKIGTVAGAASEEIDATGKLVTPGFVDIHTHYDGQAIWSDRLNPSSSHGVTTVVVGNCGVGFAPCRAGDHELLIKVMEGVEDIPGVVMAEGLPWNWETFPEYLDALDARPRDIDIAAYLPHSPLRVYAMGERGARREPATAEDMAGMRAIAREAIAAGAVGFASSRQSIHRTKAGEQIPTFDADRAELEEIARGLGDAGDGVVQLVLNTPFQSWDDELGLLRGIARASGRPATFSMGASNTGPDTVWKQALAIVDEANAAGETVSAQVFPRPIGMITGHELSVNPFVLCPSYQALAGLDHAAKLAELRKPEVRAHLVAEAPAEGHPLAHIGRNWDWMFPFADPPNYEPPLETSIGAQARAKGVKPEEIAYDYLLGEDGTAKLYVALGNYQEGRLDAVLEMMNHEHTVVGLGDGGAHYGVICDASFPTFMLTYWTRDRAGERLSLSAAVRALSWDPAQTLGLNDRGLVREGYKADLNVIDYAGLALHAPEIKYDLPAGGRRLDQGATGYDATIVSGQVIRRGDRSTGVLPGKLVRGSQRAPDL